MSRTVLYGGRIFDGTGSPIADGDVAFEDGRVVTVGAGLDGAILAGDPFDLAHLKDNIRTVYLGGRLVRGQPGNLAKWASQWS